MFQWAVKRWPHWMGGSPELAKKGGLQWLLFGRLIVCFLLLFILSAEQILSPRDAGLIQFQNALTILSFLFSVNLVVSLLQFQLRENWLLGWLNIVVDAGAITGWLVLSQSTTSTIVLLYLVLILVSAMTYYKRGALLSAFVSSVSFFAVNLQVLGRGEEAFFSAGVYSIIFLSVGLVGGYLSEELKRTSEGLQQKNQEIANLTALYERIIEGMPTGLLTLNQDMTIAFVNPGAETILGKMRGGLVGRTLKEVEPDLLPFFEQIESEKIDDESDETLTSPIETELTATGSDWHRSIFLKARLKRGQARLQQTVEFGVGKNRRTLRGDVAEIDVSGGVGSLFHQFEGVGRVLLFQDVTKLIHLEERLKQNEKLAAVGQLAAGIAHEIRNPLASMSASVQMLQEGLSRSLLQGEDLRLMQIIGKEIDRLNQLISEFLDFVKPEKFKQDLVDLEKLISEVALQIRPNKPGAPPVEVVTQLVPDLKALGNEEKLKQVLWNLVTNGLQAMKKPGKIELGCSEVSSHWVCFWVQDEGEGMTEATMQHLYEPFFTTKDKGTGLGLATVYKIVEAHQGEIKVQSQLGSGTRFEIHLHRG